MTKPQIVITVIASLLIFFGTLFIVFFTQINLLLVPIFWLVVILPAQYLYAQCKQLPQEEPPPPPPEKKKGGGTIFEREEKEEIPQEIENQESNQQKSVNPVLFSVRTLWPFDPAPDELVIREKTISFVRKNLLSFGTAMTIPIRDITDTVIYSYPLFAVLRIDIKGQDNQTYNFPLTKDDAIQAKEILDGLILSEQKVVELPKEPSVRAKKETLKEITKSKKIEEAIKKR